MDKKSYLKIGQKIKENRMKKGFTQTETAFKLNMSPQQLTNIERGVCGPPIKSWWKLSRLLFLKKDHFKTLLLNTFSEYIERIIK